MADYVLKTVLMNKLAVDPRGDFGKGVWLCIHAVFSTIINIPFRLLLVLKSVIEVLIYTTNRDYGRKY